MDRQQKRQACWNWNTLNRKPISITTLSKDIVEKYNLKVGDLFPFSNYIITE